MTHDASQLRSEPPVRAYEEHALALRCQPLGLGEREHRLAGAGAAPYDEPLAVGEPVEVPALLFGQADELLLHTADARTQRRMEIETRSEQIDDAAMQRGIDLSDAGLLLVLSHPV